MIGSTTWTNPVRRHLQQFGQRGLSLALGGAFDPLGVASFVATAPRVMGTGFQGRNLGRGHCAIAVTMTPNRPSWDQAGGSLFEPQDVVD